VKPRLLLGLSLALLLLSGCYVVPAGPHYYPYQAAPPPSPVEVTDGYGAPVAGQPVPGQYAQPQPGYAAPPAVVWPLPGIWWAPAPEISLWWGGWGPWPWPWWGPRGWGGPGPWWGPGWGSRPGWGPGFRGGPGFRPWR